MSELSEFKYFERLPPEIRNKIYQLDLEKDSSILIASRRPKRRAKVLPGAHSAGLLRVNKQIHAESKAIFYSANTFVVGNSQWNSKLEPNLHALKDFLRTVSKNLRAMIKRLEARFYKGRNSISQDGEEFRELVKLVVKNFVGVEKIDASFNYIYEAHYPAIKLAPMMEYGDLDPMAKAMALLMTCPKLEVVNFHKPNGKTCMAFWAKVAEWRKVLRKDGVGRELELVELKEIDL